MTTAVADLVTDEDHGLAEGSLGTAVFNTARTHRYLLTRRWDPARPLAVLVMLNPSTAGAQTTDPTPSSTTPPPCHPW